MRLAAPQCGDALPDRQCHLDFGGRASLAASGGTASKRNHFLIGKAEPYRIAERLSRFREPGALPTIASR